MAPAAKVMRCGPATGVATGVGVGAARVGVGVGWPGVIALTVMLKFDAAASAGDCNEI